MTWKEVMFDTTGCIWCGCVRFYLKGEMYVCMQCDRRYTRSELEDVAGLLQGEEE